MAVLVMNITFLEIDSLTCVKMAIIAIIARRPLFSSRPHQRKIVVNDGVHALYDWVALARPEVEAPLPAHLLLRPKDFGEVPWIETLVTWIMLVAHREHPVAVPVSRNGNGGSA